MTYTCDPKDPCIFILNEEPSVLYPHKCPLNGKRGKKNG